MASVAANVDHASNSSAAKEFDAFFRVCASRRRSRMRLWSRIVCFLIFARNTAEMPKTRPVTQYMSTRMTWDDSESGVQQNELELELGGAGVCKWGAVIEAISDLYKCSAAYSP